MATWPSTLPPPQKNIGIVPGDTRKERKLQSGRLEYRRFGDGKHDQAKVLFRLTWAEWDVFKEFYAHELNLGINWFSADWLADLGYDAHKARVLGYPREVALQSHFVDVLCNLIIQNTSYIVTEDAVWPCETTGSEYEPPEENNYIYTYGGYYLDYVTLCDKYTASTDAWSSMTNMPAPGRAHLAASTIGTKGYIYGGSSPSSIDCDEYTPDVWASKTNMPLPARYGLAASTIGSAGYVYGGQAAYLRQDCDEYSPDVWVSKTDMPLPVRAHLAASTIGTKGYIYGGYIPASIDCDEYTPSVNVWASKTNMPSPARYGLAASTIGSAGYVYGGSPLNLKDCDAYTPSADTWESMTDLIVGLSNLPASTLNGSGYIVGGSVTYKYTPNTWTAKTGLSPARPLNAASTI